MFPNSTSPSWLLTELFRTVVANAFADGSDPVVSQPGIRVQRVKQADYGGPWFDGSAGRKWEGPEELMSKLVGVDGNGFRFVRVYTPPEGVTATDYFAQTEQMKQGNMEAFLSCIGTDTTDEGYPCIVLVLNGEVAA